MNQFKTGTTALGSLGRYISSSNSHFQPMNCTFGIIDPLPSVPGQKKIRNKQARYEAVSERALEKLQPYQKMQEEMYVVSI